MENTRSAKRLATPRNRSARLARPLIIFALLAAFAGGLSAHVTAAPTPVSAYYFFDTTAASLQTDSFNRGKLFSQNSPGGTRLLTLDYGAARDVPSPGSGAWGTQIFGNSGVEYTNSQLLSALETTTRT